jgi:uncharacterized protein (TIGR00304 family)
VFSLILGIILLFLGILSGDVEAGIFIVFPFVSGTGIHAFLGFIFILASVFLFLVGLTDFFELDINKTEDSELKPRKKTSFKGGGVVLIGPIPIVFASNWKITVVLMIIAIILVFVAFFSFRF